MPTLSRIAVVRFLLTSDASNVVATCRLARACASARPRAEGSTSCTVPTHDITLLLDVFLRGAMQGIPWHSPCCIQRLVFDPGPHHTPWGPHHTPWGPNTRHHERVQRSEAILCPAAVLQRSSCPTVAARRKKQQEGSSTAHTGCPTHHTLQPRQQRH